MVRKRDPNEKRRKPEAVGNIVGAFLKDSNLRREFLSLLSKKNGG